MKSPNWKTIELCMLLYKNRVHLTNMNYAATYELR